MQLNLFYFPKEIRPYNSDKTYFSIGLFSTSIEEFEYGFGWKITFEFMDLFSFNKSNYDLTLFLLNFLSFEKLDYGDITIIISGLKFHYSKNNE